MDHRLTNVETVNRCEISDDTAGHGTGRQRCDLQRRVLGTLSFPIVRLGPEFPGQQRSPTRCRPWCVQWTRTTGLDCGSPAR